MISGLVWLKSNQAASLLPFDSERGVGIASGSIGDRSVLHQALCVAVEKRPY